MGFSLATSVLFLGYRDLNQVWDVITQAGFFLAPIIYPLGIVPERFHIYFYLWPPTPVIEFSRAALVRTPCRASRRTSTSRSKSMASLRRRTGDPALSAPGGGVRLRRRR